MRRGADEYRPPETVRYPNRTGSRHDDPERPGVPREAPPEPVEAAAPGPPASQPGREERPTRAGLPRATPVFGSAQPLHGTSGRLRRWAYSIPEHRPSHWFVLMAADRVDVLEDRVGSPLATVLGAVGLTGLARRIRDDPLPVVVGGAALAYLLGRRLAR